MRRWARESGDGSRLRAPSRTVAVALPVVRRRGEVRPIAGERRERVRRATGGPASAARQHDLAPDVHALHPRLADPSGGKLGLDGGPRDERQAVSCLDGAPHRLLEPELEPHVEVAEPEAEPAELVLDHLADARPLLHHDQRLVAQLVDRHGRARERVSGRHEQDHLVLHQRLEPHRPVATRSAHDAELELALGDELDDGLRVVHLERDVDGRVGTLELAEQERHDDRGRAGRGADREPARNLPVGIGGDVVEDLLLEHEQPMRAAIEPPAGLRRLDPAAGAVEKLRAEPLLERAHLQRDGRLGDAEPLRRLREAPPLDDGAEGRKLTRIHKRILSERFTPQARYAVVHNASVHTVNPFTFGALVFEDAFANRRQEITELTADMRNGQDVVMLAPRRYGKTSLVLRAATEAARRGVLVAYCDLMRTPTKPRFAAALAKTILDDLASPKEGLLERASSLFRGLRVRPTIEVDADDGNVRFTFEPSRRAADIDDTIERLLELPGEIAAARRRRAVLVFDEFQEVVRLDETLPNTMRAVFQTQPDVSHVYLGSRRQVIDAIFSDRNEPFWRSAKQMTLGRIAPEELAAFVSDRFALTDRAIDEDAIDVLAALTDGHPYATQELAYFTWELVPHGHAAHAADVTQALRQVLRAEHNNLARVWEGATQNERLVLLALREEPGGVYAQEYRNRHGLPAAASVQRAVAALERDDLVERMPEGGWRIVEPFLEDWLVRQQRGRAKEER